ncbi:MAG: hypothetical protein LBG89_03685 [Rickettsiales bacterium]|jgi:predicted nucleic acid-binding Zn ribbon protein|nr:hypothetical protein [Rickettsiales bacterium]
MSEIRQYLGYGYLDGRDEELIHFDFKEKILGADISCFFAESSLKLKWDFPALKSYEPVCPMAVRLANGDLFAFPSTTEVCQINENGERHGWFAEIIPDEKMKHGYVAKFENGKMHELSLSEKNGHSTIVCEQADGSSQRTNYRGQGHFDAENRPNGFFTQWKRVEPYEGKVFYSLDRRYFYNAGKLEYKELRKNRGWKKSNFYDTPRLEDYSYRPKNLAVPDKFNPAMLGKNILGEGLMQKLADINGTLFDSPSFYVTNWRESKEKGEMQERMTINFLYILQVFLKAIESGAYEASFAEAANYIKRNWRESFQSHLYR